MQRSRRRCDVIDAYKRYKHGDVLGEKPLEQLLHIHGNLTTVSELVEGRRATNLGESSGARRMVQLTNDVQEIQRRCANLESELEDLEADPVSRSKAQQEQLGVALVGQWV